MNMLAMASCEVSDAVVEEAGDNSFCCGLDQNDILLPQRLLTHCSYLSPLPSIAVVRKYVRGACVC